MSETTVAPVDTTAPAETAVPVTPAVEATVAPPVQAAAPARPEGLPDAYWDDAAGVKPEAYARLAELEAAESARAEGLPADASGYKLEPAEAVLDLNGQPVTFDAEDPLAQAATAWAAENKIPQGALSHLLKVFAESEVAAAKANAEAVQAEIAKLGAEHPARVAAVSNKLTAVAGADKARALLDKLSDAASFEALEALVNSAKSPAVSGVPSPAPHADLEGLRGSERLTAIRAREAG